MVFTIRIDDPCRLAAIAPFSPFDEFHPTIEMFDHSRAAFHPVACIDVFDAIHALDRGMMDMTADNAVDPDTLRFFRNHILELTNEIDRLLTRNLAQAENDQ